LDSNGKTDHISS